MFIASLICLILGLALIAAAVVIFFKFDVMEAFLFIRNKRTGKKPSTGSSSKLRRRPNLKSAGKVKANKKTTGNMDSKIFGKKKKDSSTYVLEEEDSEDPTSLLDEDSESPTGLLDEESESPTGLLDEESESPTGLLDEESESPTGLLEEDSESPTGLLDDESESPTGLLAEDSEEPTGVLDENKVITKKKDVKKKKQSKTVDSDFKFDVVKEVIVVHTKETIE